MEHGTNFVMLKTTSFFHPFFILYQLSTEQKPPKKVFGTWLVDLIGELYFPSSKWSFL